MENGSSLPESKHLVYRHDPMSSCPLPIQNVTVNNITQGIIFFNERSKGYNSSCNGDNTMYTAIEICEVKVMGKYNFFSQVTDQLNLSYSLAD